jgi:hypothetical protein
MLKTVTSLCVALELAGKSPAAVLSRLELMTTSEFLTLLSDAGITFAGIKELPEFVTDPVQLPIIHKDFEFTSHDVLRPRYEEGKPLEMPNQPTASSSEQPHPDHVVQGTELVPASTEPEKPKDEDFPKWLIVCEVVGRLRGKKKDVYLRSDDAEEVDWVEDPARADWFDNEEAAADYLQEYSGSYPDGYLPPEVGEWDGEEVVDVPEPAEKEQYVIVSRPFPSSPKFTSPKYLNLSKQWTTDPEEAWVFDNKEKAEGTLNSLLKKQATSAHKKATVERV